MSEQLDKENKESPQSPPQTLSSRGPDALFRTVTADEWHKLQAYLAEEQAEKATSAPTEKKESLSFTDLPIAQVRSHATTPAFVPQTGGASHDLPSSKEFSHEHLHHPLRRTALQEGSVLKGSYRILRTLHEGQTGVLYEAEHVRFGGTYALKVFHNSISSNTTQLKAYVQSIRALEKLLEPGLVKARGLDYDPHTQVTYYFMDHVAGMSLTQALQMRRYKNENQPPFTSEEVFDFLSKLIAPLKYAHSRQAYCTNLHPSHVIRTQDADTPVRILNFGFPIAAHTLDKGAPTNDGLQDLYYIAPEAQTPGQPITAATDVFSLGIILYQMLTGNLPVGMAQPPSRLYSIWSPQLDEVVGKATQSNWQERYQSVDALLDAVSKALHMDRRAAGRVPPRTRSTASTMSQAHMHTPLPNAQASPPPSTRSHDVMQRYQQTTPRTSSDALPSRGPSSSVQPRVSKYSRGSSDSRRTVSGSHRIEYVGSSSTYNAPPIARAGNVSPGRSNSTQRTRKPTGSHHRTQVNTGSFAQAGPPSIRTTTSGLPSTATPRASGPPTRPMMTWEAHKHAMSSASLSVDGRFLATATHQGDIKIWSAGHWSLVHTLQADTQRLTDLQWSRNGRYIAFAKEYDQLEVWDLQTQQKCHTFEAESRIQSIRWNPNGHHIYTALDEGSIFIWHLALGRKSGQLLGHKDSVESLLFIPDEDWLLSGSQDQYVHLWHVTHKKLQKQICHTEQPTTSIAKAPNSDALVLGHSDGSMTFHTFPQGEQIYTLQGHTTAVRHIHYTPSGGWFASVAQDSSIHIWDHATYQKKHTIQHDSHPIHSLGIHPSGQWMFTAGQDNTLSVWDSTGL